MQNISILAKPQNIMHQNETTITTPVSLLAQITYFDRGIEGV
jgi:hypothetical protein